MSVVIFGRHSPAEQIFAFIFLFVGRSVSQNTQKYSQCSISYRACKVYLKF